MIGVTGSNTATGLKKVSIRFCAYCQEAFVLAASLEIDESLQGQDFMLGCFNASWIPDFE
jgi:hypothetical protein